MNKNITTRIHQNLMLTKMINFNLKLNNLWSYIFTEELLIIIS